MADKEQLKYIAEAALLAAGKALNLDQLTALFEEEAKPDKKDLREALVALTEDYQGRGIEVAEVASGWRIQVRSDYAKPVSRLWDEKPGRYSRALMETLALIAYRQPITRGEIEDIRGVSVSTNITKTLLEREWVRVVGQRDVPGKPSLYGTTRTFLDYFNLKTLDDLPTLAEIRDLDEINRALDLEDPDKTTETDAKPEGDAAEGEVIDLAQAAAALATSEAGAGPETSEITSPSVEPDAAEADEQSSAEGEAAGPVAGDPAVVADDAAAENDDADFDDILPEFESDWDDGVDEDTVTTDVSESRWADDLADELEEELVQSELQRDGETAKES